MQTNLETNLNEHTNSLRRKSKNSQIYQRNTNKSKTYFVDAFKLISSEYISIKNLSTISK